ncbi:hypothetical protein BH11ARM2_BH11ARM2_29090 [soil metagenome]
MNSENELYERVLCGHLESMANCLEKLPDKQWDWTPNPAAPTARILAAHAWQWLLCDRQHIEEPDVSKHPLIPDPPREPAAMVAALRQETERWRSLLGALTPERLDSPIQQFGVGNEGNVRGFVGHMIQNAIYKNGQFMTLYYALGHDGSEPYDAPWPNPIYEETRGLNRS